MKKLTFLITVFVFTTFSYAGKGMLTITTDPSEAKIYINGQRKGTSSADLTAPFTIQLNEGEYKIEAIKTLNGKVLKGINSNIYISADNTQVINLELKPESKPQKLAVQPGAKIYNVITDPDKLREITDTYRSNPERPKDFIPQGNGTVIDKRTGLQWMRCSLGQTWTGKTCSGKISKVKWKDAMQQHPEFANHADWRLPSIAELETLVYCRSGQDRGRHDHGHINFCTGENISPTIARQVFPNTEPLSTWSSSPNAYFNDFAWIVYFNNGNDYYYYKDNSSHVRLVRGGQ